MEVTIDQIQDASNRLERLYDALEAGKVALEDLAPRIHELRRRLEQLHITRCELESHLCERRVEMADMAAGTQYVSDLAHLPGQGSPYRTRWRTKVHNSNICIYHPSIVILIVAALP